MRFVTPLLLGLSLMATGIAAAQTQVFTPRDESPEEFPTAPGRDEAFYGCTACHNFKLVAQQGMDRRRWNDTIDFMVARHNMPKPEDSERKVILDYLETAFPQRVDEQRGWQNPFLNR